MTQPTKAVDVEAADAYCKSVDDDCLCQRTNPDTPVGEHIYCFCGCHIHKAYLAGWQKCSEAQDARIEELEAKIVEATTLISMMRAQWSDSWAMEKCFTWLHENGRPDEAKSFALKKFEGEP